MATINKPTHVKTHEGGRAKQTNSELQLRRSVMACLLWEKTFYEDGQEIADRITDLIPRVSPDKVASLAIEAREQMKLRHVPLLLVREMARLQGHKHLVAQTLPRIIQRPDELTEFLSIYWKDGRQALSAQVKKGLAAAFPKFDAYQLAKYNRDTPVKLRDVLFLCHAKPKNADQVRTWQQLIDNQLSPPDTWEVALSAGRDKKATWERLLREQKLGGLALLRNLRNMRRVGVEESLIISALQQMNTSRILPFRFVAAAVHAPQWEEYLEQALFTCLEKTPHLPGKTVLLVDVSGSMESPLSAKADTTRLDAACALAMIAREVCERVEIYTFSTRVCLIPPRRGFALRDAVVNSQTHWSTYLGRAVRAMPERDRLIVITDVQSHDSVPDPQYRGYMINVASYRNGVGYGAWLHIDGFSEAVMNYITEIENLE